MGRVIGCLLGVILGLAALWALSLPLVSAEPAITAGAWVAVASSRVANAEAVTAAHRGGSRSIIELAPALFFLQWQLDRWVPYLGSALVLFGNQAVVASIVRGSWYPAARLVRVLRSRR